jgi:hypothetical protein
MSILLLAFALAAPVNPVSDQARDDNEVTCSVKVQALDAEGRPRSARRVSVSIAPAVVFRSRVSPRDTDVPTLLFDVFNPRGQRYQVLVATPRVVTSERGGQRVERTTGIREAALAVAGSSIAWTSMYGKWRVEPRLDGAEKPCGRAEFFTIQP